MFVDEFQQDHSERSLIRTFDQRPQQQESLDNIINEEFKFYDDKEMIRRARYDFDAVDDYSVRHLDELVKKMEHETSFRSSDRAADNDSTFTQYLRWLL